MYWSSSWQFLLFHKASFAVSEMKYAWGCHTGLPRLLGTRGLMWQKKDSDALSKRSWSAHLALLASNDVLICLKDNPDQQYHHQSVTSVSARISTPSASIIFAKCAALLVPAHLPNLYHSKVYMYSSRCRRVTVHASRPAGHLSY